MSAAPPNRYWFPAKRYGWGWGPPSTWQGWVVTIGWLAVFTAGAIVLAPHHMTAYLVFAAVMCAVIIAICYAKGEPPRWRWGN